MTAQDELVELTANLEEARRDWWDATTALDLATDLVAEAESQLRFFLEEHPELRQEDTE